MRRDKPLPPGAGGGQPNDEAGPFRAVPVSASENLCRHLGNREVRRRLWAKACPLCSMRGSLVSPHAHIITTEVDTPLNHVLSHSTNVTDQRVRRACARNVRIVSQRLFCAHHRGSGEIIQDRQCHETRNVLVPDTFGGVRSRATGPSPAIRRCFGAQLLCSVCARKQFVGYFQTVLAQEKHLPAVHSAVGDHFVRPRRPRPTALLIRNRFRRITGTGARTRLHCSFQWTAR